MTGSKDVFDLRYIKKKPEARQHTEIVGHQVRPGYTASHSVKGFAMNETHDENERVPLMQQLLDNPFLLLFLGVMVPMVVYTLWGVIDILTVPLAK